MELAISDIKELLSTQPCDKEVYHGLRIVVLQRGWVLVGKYYQKGNECVLKDASVVRRWGTSKGLPELANKGPLPNTEMDGKATVSFHRLTEIFSMECNEGAWSEY